jgi:UPF0755 protein
MEDLPKLILDPGHELERPKNKFNKKYYYIAGGLVFFLAYFFLLSAPSDFPKGVIFNIQEGDSLRTISLNLESKKIIRSRTAFETLVILYGGEKHLIPSDYLFEDKIPVFEVARRISKGDRHLAPISVTIPEGFTTTEIAETFSSKLSSFNKIKFLEIARGKEGYLFPDTYFFMSGDNEDTALQLMTENFEKKVAPLRSEILAQNKTEDEIIIMASLIEGEANGDMDRGYISGILWRRLAIGMPLQVDVALETYKIRGLPKQPIGNPGLASIKAAIHPVKSNYLYYLHDKEGNVYYATSFAEHKMNKAKYLK